MTQNEPEYYDAMMADRFHRLQSAKEKAEASRSAAACSPGLRRALEIIADISDKECRNAHPNHKDIIRWVTNRIEREIQKSISAENERGLATAPQRTEKHE